MPIEDLLTDTSRNLFTIAPNKAVGDAIEILAGNDIGALPVCDAEKHVVGIISERDIVRICSESDDNWKKQKISDIMKTTVFSAKPEDKIRDIIGVMKEKRIRHVPVIEKGELVAMFSVRDLFSYLLKVTQEERDTMTMAYETIR
ncbi:MAG: CBS domain-containing protein [Pseudomonadota bacterium]|nr:CBS domain-containing protein [Pseudomonadota bacterium]